MTPEAKAAVMQLMGQTYGQLKKQDEMLVGQSGNLKPKSTEMKTMVENLVKEPVAPPQQLPPQQLPPQQLPPQQLPASPPDPALQAPVSPVPVSPEQAMAELQRSSPANVSSNYHEEQSMLDFSEPAKIDILIDAVRESNLLLKGIKLQLESSNVRPKRKSAKAKITD